MLASMGEIVAIWLKRAHGGPMDPVAEAQLQAGRGLLGNADRGGKRQITIIEENAWLAAQREVSDEVDPKIRRANVLVRGLDLERTGGRTLHLGDCTIRIHGETRPCRRMEESHPGLRAALSAHWRGGVYGEVLNDGLIRIGDPAALT